ncbi:hypothetical protein ACN28E_31730 [Archangium lansingense]|uniref:hypothetical protein n=1 Tax=Archangium lansingense TaxID=2995310 RepID=UPI003B80539F
MNADSGDLSQPAIDLLLKVLREVPEPEQKQHIRVLIALLDFIADTGQTGDAEDFFINHHQYAPIAIAQFTSQEEAEEWLKGVAEPPSPAHILIGDEYYQFWYVREDNTRDMYRDYVIEPVIKALTTNGIPLGGPSFPTRAHAEQWLENHPDPLETFIVIAGEDYLAVHHKRLKRHTLHHVASALKDWEEHKRVVALEETREAGAQPTKEDE